MYWLLEPTVLENMQSFLSHTNAVNVDAKPQALDVQAKNGQMIIPVKGVLTKRPNFMAAIFHGANTSYSELIPALQKAETDPNISKIRLEVDSPGGEVDGLFALLDQIQAMSKPIVAVVDGQAASAAYGIAAACNAIYCTHESNVVGSIGVVQSYRVSKDVVDITSTNAPNKRPDVTTGEGKKVVQDHLNEIHEMFVAAISAGRKTSVDKINKNYGQGGVFLAKNALQRNMIDGIITNDSLQNQTSLQHTGSKLMDKTTLQAEHPALYAEIVQEAKQSAEGVKASEAAETERARVAAHLDMAEKAGNPALAIEHIKSGAPLDATAMASYLEAAKSVGNPRADDNQDLGDSGGTNAVDEGAQVYSLLYARAGKKFNG